MKNNCCGVYYKWITIQKRIVILKIKVKVVSDLTNYATKKELEHATNIDTSDLAVAAISLLRNLKLTD